MAADSAIVMRLRYSPCLVCQIQSRGPVISPLIFPFLSTIDYRLSTIDYRLSTIDYRHPPSARPAHRGSLFVRRHDPTEPAQSLFPCLHWPEPPVQKRPRLTNVSEELTPYFLYSTKKGKGFTTPSSPDGI